MTNHSTLLASALLAVLSLSAAQAAQPLQAARAGDQVPAALVAAPLPADESEHAPLSFAWALDPAPRRPGPWGCPTWRPSPPTPAPRGRSAWPC